MKMNFLLKIFLGLYLLGTVASQSLLDAAIIMILFTWIVTVFKSRGFKGAATLNRVGPDYFIAGYFIVICMGYAFSAAPDTPVREYIYKMTWMGHIYLLLWAISKIEFETEKLLWYFSGAFLLPTLYSLASYIHGFDFLTGRDNIRITGLVDSSTYHAHGNAMIWVFFFSIYFLNFQKLPQKTKIAAGVCFSLLALSIFLTFTRGIWLSLFLSTIIMFWKSYRKWVVAFVSTLVSGSIAAYFLWPKFQERVIHSMNSAQVDHERWSLFRANWTMFTEHPLLGIGYADNMRRVHEYWERWGMPEGYLISHAHNQLLNVLSTTGILGFITFCGFYFGFLVTTIKLIKSPTILSNKMKSVLVFACLWVQIEFILANFTDVGFEYAKIRAIIVLAWALVVALKKDLVKIGSA